jgi:hypothetical protein
MGGGTLSGTQSTTMYFGPIDTIGTWRARQSGTGTTSQLIFDVITNDSPVSYTTMLAFSQQPPS